MTQEEIKQQIAGTIDNQGFGYAIEHYGTYLAEEARQLEGGEELALAFEESAEALKKLTNLLHKHDCLF